MEGDFLGTFLTSTVRSGTPVIFALVGDLIGQRAGIISLSVEGSMLGGACAGFAVAALTGNLLLAVLAAALSGAVIGFLQAYLTIDRKANMMAVGLALMFFAQGVTAYFGASLKSMQITGFQPIRIPLLANIPLIGEAFFHQDILTYGSYLLPVLAFLLLYKTKPGIMIRSVGEQHQVAHAYGYNARAIKYGAVIAAGVLAAIGGCQLSTAFTMTWTNNMSGGRGFVASSLVILCSWKSLRGYAAAYLFGGAQALQILFQLLQVPIPTYITLMLPYIVTLFALALVSSGRNPSMPEELKRLSQPMELLN